MASTAIKRALISVSDKSAILEFASKLAQLNIEILSTGGTAKILRQNNIKVIEVSEYTNYPEIMAGRVKTLNPKIHGGILARRGIDNDVMQEHNIKPIDLLVVNLYPFQEVIAKKSTTFAQAIENIDIGGPAMLRSAAKNHAFVSVVVDIKDYDKVLNEIVKNGNTSLATRKKLALKAFTHTSKYDNAIANYLGKEEDDFASMMNLQLLKSQTMRYGENPHQKANFYKDINCNEASVANAIKIQGKELSFNNIVDVDAALECVRMFTKPSCVIVKHANPCAVATKTTIADAYEYAYKADPTSAFGGIIAFNRELDFNSANQIISNQFVEAIICPSFSKEAQKIFKDKPNIRLLECGDLHKAQSALEFKSVNGGVLVQDKDICNITLADFKCVSEVKPTQKQQQDMLFAFKVAKNVKSNAIVYAKNSTTIGIGAGQMSRIYSAKIAAIKAQDEGLDIVGSVMASDAFLPFRDGVDTAAKAGIKAIIHPGGSMRDDEVIQAANEHKIAMVFTHIRHFKH